MQTKRHIVILGGGFGGISCARAMAERGNLHNTTITLISNKTYFEYYPALYRIVTGASPIEVCVPLTDLLPKEVAIMHAHVAGVNLQTKTITFADVQSEALVYDELVIALGSETSYFNLPGVDTLSLGFKSVGEATKLKEHLASLFFKHNHPSKEELVSHFHVVIVGGGPSGVEVAGDLAVYLKKLAHAHNVDPSIITIDLIEAASRILPTLSKQVSKTVEMRLRSLGINIFLNRFLMSEDVEKVYLKDMQMQAKTVIWTAGTRINDLLMKIDGLQFSDKKRVVVDRHLRPIGREGSFDHVYVIGDAAQTKYSGLAQTAIADGSFVADVINSAIKNKKLPVYKPKAAGHVIPVGINWAALSYGHFHMFGSLAYTVRHLIDFFYFANLLPVGPLLNMYWKGYKYRKVK